MNVYKFEVIIAVKNDEVDNESLMELIEESLEGEDYNFVNVSSCQHKVNMDIGHLISKEFDRIIKLSSEQ